MRNLEDIAVEFETSKNIDFRYLGCTATESWKIENVIRDIR